MYYLIGIKGAGMSSLAMILHELGHEVAGSDYADHYFTQDPLEAVNIPIYEFNASNIKPGMKIIISNAFDMTNEEVSEARSKEDVEVFTYHEFLGHFMDQYKGISIAGTHGKTTTTGMAFQTLKGLEKVSVLIGDGTGHVLKDSEYFILESCEYRHHFLAYHPEYAIITNIELDHVDYYKTMDDYIDAYRQFADQVKKEIIIWNEDPYLHDLNTKTKKISYGLEDRAMYQAIHVKEDHHGFEFDLLVDKQLVGHYHLPFNGQHMLLNALSVIALSHRIGHKIDDIVENLAQFGGTKRRFAISYQNNDVYVDDYAHHPTAVKVTIEAARKKFPGKKIVAIYKPHRYSRMFHFVDEFASSLKMADAVYLCHFPIHQPKDEGVDIDIYYLQNRIEGSVVLDEDIHGATILAKEDNVVYLFMSSKDIYHLADLVKQVKLNNIDNML